MDIEGFLAGLPVPNADDVEDMKRRARDYTLVFLRKGPARRDDEARNERLQFEHLQYLLRLQSAGVLVLNGPVRVEHDILGVSVYATGLEEARALAEADPKVRAGYLTVEAVPWMAVSATARRDRPEAGA